jgi:GTP cyclohydrolase II
MTRPLVQRTTCARIPTPVGVFQLCHYTNDRDDKEHLALVMGEIAGSERVLARVHSECMTGDVFGSLRCDCGNQLGAAMRAIAAEGSGVIIYLRQEGRGIGLAQKLRAYNLQDEGYDTVEANLMLGHEADEREYWAAAGILADLQVRSVRLMTNNPDKIEHLRGHGIEVAERVPLEPEVHAENAAYLETKVTRMRHLLRIPAPPPASAAELPVELATRVTDLQQRAVEFWERNHQPFVTLSYAQSLDGSIALRRGERLTLSGPESMTLTHALRTVHDAILVGIDTVVADDPRLTVRLVNGADPQPIVLDSTLRFPAEAQLLRHPRGVWIATTAAHAQDAPSDPRLRIVAVGTDGHGRVDLRALLAELGQPGIRSLMVEGGARVLTSFLQQTLANYAVITIAPRWIGGISAVELSNAAGQPTALPQLTNVRYTPGGTDLVAWGELETSPKAEIFSMGQQNKHDKA